MPIIVDSHPTDHVWSNDANDGIRASEFPKHPKRSKPVRIPKSRMVLCERDARCDYVVMIGFKNRLLEKKIGCWL